MTFYRRLRSTTCIGVLLIGTVVSAAAASPAAATQGSLDELVGPVTARARAAVVDGSCPIDYSTGVGHREPHQAFTATVRHGRRLERIHVSVCWHVNGAIGGNSTERGTFKIRYRRGVLAGSIEGLVGFTNVSNVFLHMDVKRATGRFRGITGELTLAGCMEWYEDASPLYNADLAVGSVTAYRYRSYVCTGPDTPSPT